MAAEKKKTKRRQKAAAEEPETTPEAEGTTRAEIKGKAGAEVKSKNMLRLRTDPRQERRYEPTAPRGAWISVTGLSGGSVLLGAGVYGQWLRASLRPEMTEPHPYAPYLLMAGALVLVVVALFGPR